MLAKNITRNKTILFCDVSHNDMEMKDVITIASHLDNNLAAFEQTERSRRKDQAVEEKMQQEFEDKQNVSDVWQCMLMMPLFVCCSEVFIAFLISLQCS